MARKSPCEAQRGDSRESAQAHLRSLVAVKLGSQGDFRAIASFARIVFIPHEQLRHLSPLGWDHIQLTGDYRWNMQLVTTLEQRRPVRSSLPATP